MLTFPPKMLEQMGWKEGDTLSWDDNGDGSFMLSKKDKSSD
jgi:bifunctional DNA-binding transcriptional regulator/antitoxin component of YhaV-PrlF toxin-antitoxin module